jgi:hypothetical protein
MSKLIVDQLQKTGGTPLTLPSDDGTNGSTLITDGSGNLSFGAPPESFPTASSDGLVLKSTNASGGVGWYTDGTIQKDTVATFGWLMGQSARENIYSTSQWSSGGGWTTYNASLQDGNSAIQTFNMILGDQSPNTTSAGSRYSNDDAQLDTRKVHYASGQRIGHYYKDIFYYDNASTGNDYAGVTGTLLPLRNYTSSAKTVILNYALSMGGGNGYGGGGVGVWTPNTGSYYDVTNVSWEVRDYAHTNDNNRAINTTVTIQPNQTVIVMAQSTHRYQTTYRYKDTHHLDIDAVAGDWSSATGVRVDNRILRALERMRRNQVSYSDAKVHEVYQMASHFYGNQ